MEMKTCKKCGNNLPVFEFFSNDNTCKNCRREARSGFRTPDILHCPVCNKDLPYYEFNPSKKGKTGRVWCCKCCETKNAGISPNNFRKNYDKEFRDLVYKQKRESRIRNFTHAMWKAAQNRAKRKGIEFNIEESDIIIPDKCPLLEVPFEFGTKGNYSYSPSLDRIDNTLGYIKGNIQVISSKANAMKNSATLKELQIFCKNILRYSPIYLKSEEVELKDKEPLG